VLNRSGFQIGGDYYDESKFQSKNLTSQVDRRPWPRGLVHVREARGHHWFRRVDLQNDLYRPRRGNLARSIAMELSG